ncbi:hypothetical protein GCM10023350_41700 [Nocardioides endophyticus]|uniref:Uncharacterized protein n=1 Tax=Nocardioides endophyticus TaxID=1353775 RepID=A0ABP8ZBE1_9ACTN
MSDEHATHAIEDEDLPEDLQPTDDNPLAKPLTDQDDPKSPEELDVLGGKTADETTDESTEDETSASED